MTVPEFAPPPVGAARPEEPRSFFAVEYVFTSDKRHRQVRPAHREYLAGLAAEGRLALSGPLVSDTGGLLIFQARTDAEVWEMVDRDPYTEADVLSRVRLEQWDPVLGYLTPHLED